MKAIKKIFAILLAVAMLMGLSVTAFADTEKGSITVKNADSTATYKAYKIFDATYADTDTNKEGNEAYAYTISTTSDWLTTVLTYMGYTKVDGKWYANTDTSHNNAITSPFEGKGLTLTLSADKTKYVVTVDEKTFSAADFAEALYAALEGYTVVDTSTTTAPVKDTTYYTHVGGQYVECKDLSAFENGVTYYTKGTGLSVKGTELSYDENEKEASASNLDLGYYFVTSSVGSLANLTTTEPDVTIYDKNEQPPFDKTVDDHDVEIGQTVNYTITGKVPSTTGYTTYTYKVSDTLDSGLTFNKDVKVTFGTTTITPSSTELVYNTADDGFVLTFDMTNYQGYVGQTITITYSAVVNENAVVTTEGNPNEAKLEYSNDPDDSTSTDTETDVEKVYTVDLTIDKYATNADDENDKSTKLSGAEFILVKKDAENNNAETYYQATVYAYTYKTTVGEETVTVTVYSNDGKTYYTDIACKTEATIPSDATPEKGAVADITWVSDIKNATTVTTDPNGAATFDGLEVGTYYLRETKAPDGYNMLTSDEEVTISRGTDSDNKVTLSGTSAAVANSAGTKLPSTGGIGTTIFYVVGSILVLGAAILLIVKKRMSGKQE